MFWSWGKYMANIVITEKCNLACPYCFADEFVHKASNEISLENFKKALLFVESSKSFGKFIGLIGGEPTLHSKFSELLEFVNFDNQLKEVLIFTNGIRINETFSITSQPKFTFLINLNSPQIIGSSNYFKIMQNIDSLISKYNKNHSLTLGLNLYALDLDYTFFVDTLERFKLKSARLSITVPNLTNGNSGIDKVAAFKPLIYKLYVDLLYRGIHTVFDCNKIPPCLWSDKELLKISLFQANNTNERIGFNLTTNKCNPVIDILPDLTAIRCFGLSGISKVKIDDFSTLDDLYLYYLNNFDRELVQVPAQKDCNSCEMFLNNSCYSGCLANKIQV